MSVLEVPLSELEENLAAVANVRVGEVFQAKDAVTAQVIEAMKGKDSTTQALVQQAQLGAAEGEVFTNHEGELVMTEAYKQLFQKLYRHLKKNRGKAQANTGISFANAEVDFIDPRVGGFFNTVAGNIGVNAFAVFTDKLNEILTHEGFHKRHHANKYLQAKTAVSVGRRGDTVGDRNVDQ